MSSGPPSASALTAVEKRLIAILVRIVSLRRTRQMGELGDRVRLEDIAGTPLAVALEDFGLECYRDGQDSMRPSRPRDLADLLEPAIPPPLPLPKPQWNNDEHTPIIEVRMEDADTSPGSPRAMRKVNEESVRAARERLTKTGRGFPPYDRQATIPAPPPKPKTKP